MTKGIHSFDQRELSAFLQARISGFGEIREIEKFSDGQSNPTYRIETSSKRYVLRAKPPGKLLRSAHQVDREFRVMAALADTNVPVPHVDFLSGEKTPLGVMFFVMELVEGQIFWDPALPELDRAARSGVYDQMASALAALHGVDPNAVGLDDFGAPGNYFERQLSRWSRQYLSGENEPEAQVKWLIDWLGEHLVAEDGQRSIVHGDYRIDNMIFSQDTNRLSAILDWELSTIGHPMADVAFQAMQWRQPPGHQSRGLGDLDRAALGIPDEADYVAAYCEKRGLAPTQDWAFYLAFSFFRMIAILQGVVNRAAAGNASNPAGVEGFRRAIPELTRQAVEIAKSRKG